MRLLPIRLRPGDDLRLALESHLPGHAGGAFVLSGIGSLSVAAIRFAGAPDATRRVGDFELLTLAGTVSPGSLGGTHLHATLADAAGAVVGGHVAPGCSVRTTAEVLIAIVDDWALERRLDPATGYPELTVQRR